jgi:hypothetical protein
MDWIEMSEGEWIRRGGEKKEKRRKKENEKNEKIKIGKGNLDILQPQSNWRNRFAKRFPKRLRLHKESRSTRGARAGAVFRGAGALPNRPLFSTQHCSALGQSYFVLPPFENTCRC